MPYLKPFSYQNRGIEFASSRSTSAILGAIGSGKTVIGLSTIADWFDSAMASKVLIIAPPSVINDTFPKEIEKWDQFKHLTYEVLNGPHKEKRIRRNADIYLSSYDANTLRWLFVHPHCPRFDAAMLDESHNVKAQGTKRFKILKVVMPCIPQKLIMTGTVMGNTLRDLWAQFYLLDGGKRLFRAENAFLHWWFIRGEKEGQWFPKRGAKEEIARAIADMAYEIDVSKVKLPKLREEMIEIELPRKVLKQYRKLEKEAFFDLTNGDRITTFSIRSVFQKCRQVANGFIYNEEDGIRKVYNIHEEKIKAIQQQIKEAQGRGVMIVANFTEEVERLKRLYPNMGWINGSTTARQRRKFIDAWNRKEISEICIHPQSGGEGINLQHGGDLQIWSSLGWSSIRHNQTIGRLWRTGQESKEVTVRYLIAKDTIDEPMSLAIKSHARDAKAFLKILKSYQKQLRRVKRY